MPQCKVVIKGIVQGVGFRPFVYRIAKQHCVNGYIRNAGNSVELLLDGDENNIQDFMQGLKLEHPPMAKVHEITVMTVKTNERFEDFVIRKSRQDQDGNSIIPPDMSICKTCVKEIFDNRSRRYLYPFTTCTDCGNRFTIIENLPYDRENTNMKDFLSCRECASEYSDVKERRFMAETICCPACGPKYDFYMGEKKLAVSNPIKEAANAIEAGKIVAIKGMGGTHLVTKTAEDEPVCKIRNILQRKHKPFAIMAKDVDSAMRIAYVRKMERKLLESFQRPIVVLRKKAGAKISDHIAPGLHNIGIMLPYSGIHHLVFYYSGEPAFVMTSANIPGEPMAIDNEEILSLKADYSLVHNMRINNRCDDSVMKIIDGREVFLRRSRGFVPQPIELKIDNTKNVLALGAEQNVAPCLLKGRRAIFSQYVGNTAKLKTLEHLEEAIHSIKKIAMVNHIDVVAVDLHQGLNTTRLGKELAGRFGAKLSRCQHHQAHIASLMAENGIEKIAGIVADGAGCGTDNTTWGGEIFSVDNGFERIGSLIPQIMPGGDLAALHPARMLAGILSRKYHTGELKEMLYGINGFRNGELDLVSKQIDRRFNTPATTSAGRVLDAIAAALDVCQERTYEGEPAVRLEAFAYRGKVNVEMPVVIKKLDGRYVLDTTELLDAVLNARGKHRYEDIAASAQNALADGLASIAITAAKKGGIDSIGISGGVAYNCAMVTSMKEKVEGEGFRFFTQRRAPCGDGGISLGQAVIAARNLDFHLVSSNQD